MRCKKQHPHHCKITIKKGHHKAQVIILRLALRASEKYKKGTARRQHLRNMIQ